MAKTVVLNIKVNDQELDQLKTGLTDLGADFSVVEKGAQKVEKGVGKIGKSSYVFQELNKYTGGLAGNLVDVYNGLGSVKIGLTGIRTALIATGIGAFVVALGLIVAYWDEIVEFITGANNALEEQKRITEEINRELERRNQLEKDNQRLQKNQEEINILKAKIAGATEQEITNIRRQGFLDRIAIAEEEAEEAERILELSLGADLDTLLKAQKEQEKAFANLGIARGALSVFDLQGQLPEKEKKNKGDRRPKVSKSETIRGEDELKRRDALFQELFDQEKIQKDLLQDAADTANAQFLNSTAVFEASQYEIKKKYADLRMEIDEEERQAKITAMYAVSDALMAVGDLVGKQTAAGKGLAVAGALINTYLGITQILASKSTLPEPFGGIAKIASAIAVGASGFAAVKNILAVKVPGGGGGSGGGGGTSPTRPPSFNVVGNSPQNQLNQALLEQNKEPVKAYVLEGEVTTAQQARRNKVKDSSI